MTALAARGIRKSFGPLASLPLAALAAIVFLIAIGLIDVGGMRRILACRRREFTIALLTTAAVGILGVEEGIARAVAARTSTTYPTPPTRTTACS